MQTNLPLSMDFAIRTIKRMSIPSTVLLYSLLGIAILFFHSHTGHYGKTMRSQNIILFCVIGGPFIGNLAGWICGSMFYGLSKNFFYMREDIQRKDVWSALAFTNIGLILAGFLIVVEYLIYGDLIFQKMNVVEYMDAGSKMYYYMIEMVKISLLVVSYGFAIWILARLLDISIVQSLTVNFVSALLVYGLGRIILFITANIIA